MAPSDYSAPFLINAVKKDVLAAQRQVNDADKFLLGIESNDALGLALKGADEQEGNTANLENIGYVAVFFNIDTVEVHLAVVMLRNLSQHGFQSLAWLAPVGIEVHHDRSWATHRPIDGIIVGYKLLELLLVDGVHGIDSVGVIIALGINPKGQRHSHQHE